MSTRNKTKKQNIYVVGVYCGCISWAARGRQSCWLAFAASVIMRNKGELRKQHVKKNRKTIPPREGDLASALSEPHVLASASVQTSATSVM